MSNPEREPAIPDFLAKLGLAPPYSVEDVKQAYRNKVKTAHPDVGGSAAEFAEIQAAYEQALEYVRFRASRITWLSSHVEQYSAQQAFVADLEHQGGAAEIEGVDWLKKSFGADFAQLVSRIVGLRLSGQQFGDDTIAHLLSERHLLDNLHWLDLSDSSTTDRGAARLVNFPRLRRLDLRGTSISRQAGELIGLLPHLKWVGLPPGLVGPVGRMALRWRRPELRWARTADVCGTPDGDR
jgi:DnaJ-like protein